MVETHRKVLMQNQITREKKKVEVLKEDEEAEAEKKIVKEVGIEVKIRGAVEVENENTEIEVVKEDGIDLVVTIGKIENIEEAVVARKTVELKIIGGKNSLKVIPRNRPEREKVKVISIATGVPTLGEIVTGKFGSQRKLVILLTTMLTDTGHS